MKKLLASLLLFVGFANAQTETPVVTTPQFYDDTYVHVPLQFGFPFYGRTFTNSWMHSNGIVSFLDPAVPIEGVGYNPGQWAYCCGDRPTTYAPQYSYMIAPLWTDLYPDGQSTFRTEGTSQYQKYFWTNLGEISNTNNRSTFSLELRPTGYIGVNYSQINMYQTAWIGTVGNPTRGEINEIFYGIPGLNYTGLTGWSSDSTPVQDMCVLDPLSSPTCPGYTTAMCVTNPLYSTSCSGYAQAYYTQQCSANPLYDVGCPGYASAYLDYQCSQNALYSPSCPGYETAYFNQQCSLDALYSPQCDGYADAFYIQQCTLNPLYDVGCTGYEQAYFNQQCLANGLYSTQCPNYAEAYAADQALKKANAPIESTPVIATTEKVAEVAVVSDPVVNDVITTTSTSASPAAAATATVSLVAAVEVPTTTVAAEPAPAETTKTESASTEESTEESSNVSTSSVSESSTSTTNSGSSSSSDKEKPKTTRQQLAEARREAARAKAIEEGKKLASTIGDSTSMEQQVAVQNVVLSAMGFVPGFDAYGKAFVPDSAFYKPFEIYKNQSNVDNVRASKGLIGASDRLHSDMVNSQWEITK